MSDRIGARNRGRCRMAKDATGAFSVSVLTSQGRGAIGVVRVWGAGALSATGLVFRSANGRGLETTNRRRPRLGRIGAGLGDEVMAIVLDGDPPEVEIQCHGGPAAVDLVVEAFTNVGGEH